MRHTPITLLCLFAALAAPGAALAQEPEEPEPIPDFWTETAPKPEPAPAEPQQAAPQQAAPQQAAPQTTAMRPAQHHELSTAPPAPECDAQLVVARAAKAGQRALRKDPLLGTARRKLTVRVRSCAAGELQLRLVDAAGSTTVARGRTAVEAGAPSKLTLRLTPAGRRYERRVAATGGGRYRLRITARFVPEV